MILDSQLSMDAYVSRIFSVAHFHMRAVRHIRPLLDLASAKIIACSTC